MANDQEETIKFLSAVLLVCLAFMLILSIRIFSVNRVDHFYAIQRKDGSVCLCAENMLARDSIVKMNCDINEANELAKKLNSLVLSK